MEATGKAMSHFATAPDTVEQAVDKPLVQFQIEYARHNFDNLQTIIRFIDTKAAGLITIVIFLAASGIQVAKDAMPALRFSTVPKSSLAMVFVGGCLGFLVSFTWITIYVQRVMTPRGGRNYAEVGVGRDLMWQNHVLLHGSKTIYSDAVQAASPELLLRNVTDQIFELCNISKEKMDAFQQARIGFWPAFCSWLLTIASSILLMRWK